MLTIARALIARVYESRLAKPAVHAYVQFSKPVHAPPECGPELSPDTGRSLDTWRNPHHERTGTCGKAAFLGYRYFVRTSRAAGPRQDLRHAATAL